MATLPSSLALTNVADGASIVAADHRNNYSAIQTEANALITILGAGTAGDVFTGVGTTVQYAKPPGYEFSYDEFTASVTGIAGTNVAGATTVKTSASVTFDGSTIVIIEFWCPSVQTNTLNFRVKLELFEDATDLGELTSINPGAANIPNGPVYATRRRTPAAGAHTYTVKAFVPDGGTGQVNAGVGGGATVLPGYIRVRKV